jgi:hypothetical protein
MTWQVFESRVLTRGRSVTKDEERVLMAVHIAKELAMLLLQKHGVVLPFGLTLESAKDEPHTYFPRDQMPDAEWDELIDAVIAHLMKRSASVDVNVCVLATTLESGSQSGLGLQIETRDSVFFLLCPYTGSGQRWQIEEAQAAEGLLVEPFISTAGPQ